MKLDLAGVFSVDALALANAIEGAYSDEIRKLEPELRRIRSEVKKLTISVAVFNPSFGLVENGVWSQKNNSSVAVRSVIAFDQWHKADTSGKVALFRDALQQSIEDLKGSRLEDALAYQLTSLISRASENVSQRSGSIVPDESLKHLAALILPEVPKVGRPPETKHVRLYRQGNQGLEYYEAWLDGKEVVEHWGLIGERGQDRIHPIRSYAKGVELIDELVKLSLKSGFEIAEEADLDQLRVRIRPEPGCSWSSSIVLRHKLEDVLDQDLGWKGLGFCDGGDTGKDSIDIFCLVIDRDIARREILASLAKSGHRNALVVER